MSRYQAPKVLTGRIPSKKSLRKQGLFDIMKLVDYPKKDISDIDSGLSNIGYDLGVKNDFTLFLKETNKPLRKVIWCNMRRVYYFKVLFV